MILNLKNKRVHQIDTLHHLINKSSNGMKSHREEQLNLSRQAKEMKTNRINSNHGVKKTTPSGISTTTGANTSSHTHMNTHLSFLKDVDNEQMESSSQEGKTGRQLEHAKVVNVYKKLKKYEMGETSLYPDKTEVLKEPSRQKKCSTHKSQKISHKREITANIVQPQEDKCEQKIVLSSRANQCIQELIQSLIYLFNTDLPEINTKSHLKAHRERRNRDQPLFQERRQDQMLIREDQSIEVRPPGQEEGKSVEAILSIFLGRMSVVEGRLKDGTSQEYSKHSSNRNEPRMSANRHSDCSASKLLMHIKSFIEELVLRMCEESNKTNTHLAKIAQNLGQELQESTLQCQQLSADLENQLAANQKLIEQILQIQSRSSNSMVILNELSKNFDMQRFVQNRFTLVGLAQESLEQSSCFVKSKEPQQIQASDSMYEVVGKHNLALNLQKLNSKKGEQRTAKVDSAKNKPASHRNLEGARC